MRLQFVTIGQNLNWPRGRLSLARKKTWKGIYDRFSSSKNSKAGHENLKMHDQNTNAIVFAGIHPTKIRKVPLKY